jgi:hypothetical protein
VSVNGRDVNVTIGASHSTFSNDVVYRDNCVSSPAERIIDCDLKLIDDFINEFRLVEIGDALRSDKYKFYRRALLPLVLAHEIGHIALRHGLSDLHYLDIGETLFDEVRQKKELEADAYAINLIGKPQHGSWGDSYLALVNIANMLILMSVCRETFPKVCKRLLPGAGLAYPIGPIFIPLGTTHPAFLTRFLRILYLAGVDTDENNLNHQAIQLIDQLQVHTPSKAWVSLKQAIENPEKN